MFSSFGQFRSFTCLQEVPGKLQSDKVPRLKVFIVKGKDSSSLFLCLSYLCDSDELGGNFSFPNHPNFSVLAISGALFYLKCSLRHW